MFVRRSVRWNSTISKVLESIKNETLEHPREIGRALATSRPSEMDSACIHEIVRENPRSEIVNEILTFGLPYDFSLYFSASKRKQPLQWNEDSLASLIENNPGRVFTSSDLLDRHGKNVMSDRIRKLMLQKLLFGEHSDADDAAYSPGNSNLIEAIQLINTAPNIQSVAKELTVLFSELGERGGVSALSLIELSGFHIWLKNEMIKTNINNVALIRASQIIFEAQASLLDKDTIGIVLKAATSVSDTDDTIPKEFSGKSPLKGIKKYIKSLLQYVEEHHYDEYEQETGTVDLRAVLISAYGITLNDVKHSVEKFLSYKKRGLGPLDLAQRRLVQALCYSALRNGDKYQMETAKSIIGPEKISATSLVHLILGCSRFKPLMAIDLNNNYVTKLYDNDKDIPSGRTGMGLSIEALVVAYLNSHDLQFAEWIYERAIVNGSICNQREISAIKRTLTTFRNLYNDNWQTSEPIYQSIVLERILNT